MRRSQQSAFTSPVLVGAVTILVGLVAVFLAYNANQGLPFVPTRELKVDVADGSNLVVGNDVREGGFRVGLVSGLRPVELASGVVGAELTLQLDQANGRVPVDSRFAVRPLSVLGLKYVDLERGSSARVFADGATVPISQTSVPVQFDDIFKMFDPRTRSAVQQNLVGFGDTFAARGSALNDTVSSLPELFGHLRPVAGYLSAPGTGLTRFFDGLNSFVAGVAPVAARNADLFRQMATTFAAISRDPQDLEQTISQSPSTLSVGTDSLRVQQPFLVDLTSVGTNLQPATSALEAALPQVNPAIEAGTSTLARSPALDAKLQQLMNALKTLAQAPETNVAVNALTATVQTLNPMIRYLGPYQTACDYWNYWWTYLSEHISALTSYGYAQRALINLGAISGNGVGEQGSYAPASNTSPGLPFAGGTENLHAQQYGAAIDNLGNADCEAGQRGYPLKLNPDDPQGRDLALAPRTPGDQGPTFNGRARGPAGETFTRNPQTGPQLGPGS
jgi:virulence factor Mce-like protein